MKAKPLIVLLLAAATFFMAGPVFAQDAGRGAIFVRKTIIVFPDDTLETGILRRDLDIEAVYILPRFPRQASLILVRDNFRQKVLFSAASF